MSASLLMVKCCVYYKALDANALSSHRHDKKSRQLLQKNCKLSAALLCLFMLSSAPLYSLCRIYCALYCYADHGVVAHTYEAHHLYMSCDG